MHRGRLSRPSRRGSVHARRLPQVRDPSAETARSMTGPPQPRPEYLLGGAFEVIGIMGCEQAREATASCGLLFGLDRGGSVGRQRCCWGSVAVADFVTPLVLGAGCRFSPPLYKLYN